MKVIKSASFLGRLLATAVLILAAFAAPALAQEAGTPPVKVTKGVLTDMSGMTLYTWDADPPGKSLCKLGCSMSWPPLVAKEGSQPSGDYTIITREDDRKQWAYRGKPLYRWDNDKKPGDRRTDNPRWHVIVPTS